MSTCSTLCGTTLPPYPSGCTPRLATGGIERLVFLACDVDFTSAAVTEESFWDDLITSCKIRISPPILGSKARGSFTKARPSSCLPEVPIYGTKTVNFSAKDYPTDLSNFTFWNEVDVNQQLYKVGWFMCNGELYGFYPYASEVDEEFGDNKTTERMITGVITIESREMLVPTDVLNGLSFDLRKKLVDHITYDCESGLYTSASGYQTVDWTDFVD